MEGTISEPAVSFKHPLQNSRICSMETDYSAARHNASHTGGEWYFMRRFSLQGFIPKTSRPRSSGKLTNVSYTSTKLSLRMIRLAGSPSLQMLSPHIGSTVLAQLHLIGHYYYSQYEEKKLVGICYEPTGKFRTTARCGREVPGARDTALF